VITVRKTIPIIVLIFMLPFLHFVSATVITTTTTITATISSVPITTVITTTISVSDSPTQVTTNTSTEDVYQKLYSAMLRISYLEQVSQHQSSSISSLLAQNSSLSSQNSIYMNSLSSVISQLGVLSSEVSSLSYANAMLSAQLSYYKENYNSLYTAVAINFNELNSATSFYSSVSEQQKAAKRTLYGAVFAVFLAIVGTAWLYRKLINYKTMRRYKKRIL